jgi:hypothetical protein
MAHPAASYAPNGVNFLAAHLDFALKHEGGDISLLAALFVQPGLAADLEEYVHSRPTSQYARRAWFLYEFLTRCRLDLPDASQGGYVNLLDPAAYVTATPVNSSRQRAPAPFPHTPSAFQHWIYPGRHNVSCVGDHAYLPPRL